MTRSELQAFFPPLFIAPLNMGAASYAVPTLAWLQGPLWEFFRGRYWAENLDKWATRWECRDFASAYRVAAIECWASSLGVQSSDDGLAVGEIWFKPDSMKPTQAHAICPAITDQGLVFIEPQNNTVWPMSPEQFASRFYLRF